MRSIQAGIFALKVLMHLKKPKTFSELVKESGLKPNELAATLNELGKKGFIVKEDYRFRRILL